jgi:hypothetical protein
MDIYELARRARVLPDLYATRLPPATLAGLRQMAGGGEYGELVIELTATLAKSGVIVSADEQQELRALLAASGWPPYPADQLSVGE